MSCPPSSYPTYPGGAPTRRETLCFSIYSDISIRIMPSSRSKRDTASDLASSVFPTPVGPRNRNEPIGRFGSLIPALARSTASATKLTASSWPTTRSCSVSSRRRSLSRSPSTSRLTGTPVQRETISAISSSVTASRSNLVSWSCCAASSAVFS
ncbi:hypothetical protein D3C76_1196070 [compost metagenome]